MYLDAAIFASFLGLALCFDRLERWLEHHRPKHTQDKDTQAGRTKHYAGWVMVATSHPAVWNAAHEFVVHIVVYSGKVFPPH